LEHRNLQRPLNPTDRYVIPDIVNDEKYKNYLDVKKIMALAVENKEFLHQEVLEENIRLMQDQLLDYIFEKEGDSICYF
jgi:hypothetical protein